MNNIQKNRLKDNLFKFWGIFCTIIGLVLLLVFIGDILIDGLRRIDWGFITSLPSRKPEKAGIYTALMGSIWILVLTTLIAVPVIIVQLIMKAFGPDQPGYWSSFYTSYFVAGLVEESGKLAVIMLVAWRRPEFDERMDGLVYGAYAGLGFALVIDKNTHLQFHGFFSRGFAAGNQEGQC